MVAPSKHPSAGMGKAGLYLQEGARSPNKLKGPTRAVTGGSAREGLLFPELNSLGFKALCWRKSPFLLEAQT